MKEMFICLILFLTCLHAEGEYQTYFPDILGGGWKLVRRVRKGGRWHPATDQLRGSEVYGVFSDNPTADRTFSRRFDTEAFDQFLFITGDEQKWLVADKAEVLGFYSSQPRQVIASSISKNPYEAKWFRRQRRKEDPAISLTDNEEAKNQGQMLYLGNKYEDADVLDDHNGANVFIRMRDYKVYVSGFGNFELQAPIQEQGLVWSDRSYMFRSFPDFLQGGVIAHGPYEKLKQGKQLDIRVTHPSTVYVMVVHLPDRRNGGFLKSLPKRGWELMKLKALLSKHKLYIFRKSVEDVERLPAFETGQTVMSIVAKRQYVNVGKSQCMSEIGQNPCFFHKEDITLHDCQAGCLLYEECIGWTDIGSKHCHLFFTETAGVVRRKFLAEGWRWGSDTCGGMTITGSSERSKTFSCFKKKDRKDLLKVSVTGCCKFGPNVPVGPYSQIWNDQKFQFRQGVPRYLLGATLVRGPQKAIPVDTYLKIELSRPSMVYVLVNTDKRNGGWRENLPRDGWTKLDEIVRWQQEMEIYAKPINKEVVLPRTRTSRTIMAIVVKASLTEPGNLLCYAGYVDSKYLRQPKPYAYTDVFPTRESCRYHCLVSFQSQGYSYYTSGNYNECRCGRTGTSMEELMTDSNQELDRRRSCLANDNSVMEWCTCETTTVSYLEKSCYGADQTGLFTLRSANIPVYCDMDFEGGKWLLLLTQTSATEQYSGSVSPLVTAKSPFRPNAKQAYSRDWRTSGIEPKDGDEFMIKRGTSGDFIRFVVTKWCGWGDKLVNCETGKNQHHPFLATGVAYDKRGRKLEEIKYFNGCAYGGTCGEKGVDGIGFGSLENHLRATYGDRGYGGTGFPGALRWNSADEDKGDNLPYTYWYRPAKSKGEGELAKQISVRLKKEGTKEKTYKSLVHMCRADHANKVSQLAYERMRKSRNNFETKWDRCTHDRKQLEKFWEKKNAARMDFWKKKIREKHGKCERRVRRQKKLFRLKRVYLSGRLHDEVKAADEHYKRYQKRIEALKEQVKKNVAQYDEARDNTSKWMKRYFALKRRMRLSDAERAKEDRERKDALLNQKKPKGPSMDELLREEKKNREGIDSLGQKYLKGKSKGQKRNEAMMEKFREGADKEKRDKIRAEMDAKMKEKLAKEQAKRLQDQLNNADLKKPRGEKVIVKTIGKVDDGKDSIAAHLKAIDAELKDPDCKNCEKMADKELHDALDDSDDEDGSEYEIDLDDDPGGTVMASLHKKVWSKSEGCKGGDCESQTSGASEKESKISSVNLNAAFTDVSPEDLGKDLKLEDLDDAQTDALEKRLLEENRRTNQELRALGDEPIDLDIGRRLLAGHQHRHYDERGVGEAAPPAKPHIKYVPVAMPLNVAAARGYPVPPARAFYRPIGTRVMKQKPLAAVAKSTKQKKKKPHLHGDGSSRRKKRKHKKEHKHRPKKEGEKSSSVKDVVKSIEGAGKDLAEKKKDSTLKQDDDKAQKKEKGPKAEKSGKIFKKDDVVEHEDAKSPDGSTQHDRMGSGTATYEKAVNTDSKKEEKKQEGKKEEKKPEGKKEEKKPDSKKEEKKSDSKKEEKKKTEKKKDEGKKEEKKEKPKKKKRKSRKKSKKDGGEYGGFTVEELKKLSLEDDVEGKFLEQHHKLVLSNKDRDLCQRTKDIVEQKKKKLSMNLRQCVQKYERVERYHKEKIRIEKDLQKEISSSCEAGKVSLKNLWREKFNAQGKLCEDREAQFKKELKLALEKNNGESALKGKLAGCEEDASMARQATRKAKKEVEETKDQMEKLKNYAQKRIRQLKNLHKSCDKRGAMELVAENDRIKAKYRKYKDKRLAWKKERHMYVSVIKDLKNQLKKLMKEEYERAKKLTKDEAKDDTQLYGENLDDETKDLDKTKLRYSRKSASRVAYEEEMKKKEKEQEKKDKENGKKKNDDAGAEDEDENEMSVMYAMKDGKKKMPKETATPKEKKKDDEKVSDKKKDYSKEKASKSSAPEGYKGEDHASDTRARKQMEIEEKKKIEKDANQLNYDDDNRPTKGKADDDERKGNTQVAVASAEGKDSLIEQVKAALKEGKEAPKVESKPDPVKDDSEDLEQGDSESDSAEDDLGKKTADSGDPLKGDNGEDAKNEEQNWSGGPKDGDEGEGDIALADSEPNEPLPEPPKLLKQPEPAQSYTLLDSDYDEVDLNEPTEEEKHENAVNFGPSSNPANDDEFNLDDQNLDDTEPNEVLHPDRFGPYSESDALRRLLRR